MDYSQGGGGGGWDRGGRSQQQEWGGGRSMGGGGGFGGQQRDGGNRGFGGIRSGGRDDSMEIEVSCRDVPRIIGRGGSKIKEMEETSGARIKIRKDKDNGVTTVVELKGSPDSQQHAKQLIEDYVASRDSYGDRGGQQRGNYQNYGGGGNNRYGGGGAGGFGQDYGGGRGGGGGGFGGQDRYSNDPGIEMEIPTTSIARVIGKGGSKIRELQETSGARIKILRDREEGSNTIVEIKGSEESKQAAKTLIEEFITPQEGAGW